MTDISQIFANTSNKEIPFEWYSILRSSFDIKFKVYLILIILFSIIGLVGLYYYCTRLQSINDKYTRIINSERLCRNKLILVRTIFSLPYHPKNHFHIVSYNEWIQVALNQRKKLEHEEYTSRKNSKNYYQGNSNINTPLLPLTHTNTNIPIIRVTPSLYQEENNNTTNSLQEYNNDDNDKNILPRSFNPISSSFKKEKANNNNDNNNNKKENHILPHDTFNNNMNISINKNDNNNTIGIFEF